MQAWPRSLELGAVGLCCGQYLFQGESPSFGHISALLPCFPRSLYSQEVMWRCQISLVITPKGCVS